MKRIAPALLALTLGPAWPGGDQPTQTISAARLMWDFFAAHPKP